MIRFLLKYKTAISLFLFINSFYSAQAQEKGLILSKYYSPKEYNAQNQNWAIAEDQRGVLYFGNNGGVLEYDGETWRLIPVLNGSGVRCLAFDTNNILYSGAYNELGYLSPDNTGNMTYHTLTHLIDSSHLNFGEIWDVNCFSDSVFFLTNHFLIRYVNGKFDYWESKNENFLLSHKINDSYFVQDAKKGLFKFESDSLRLIDKGEFFIDKAILSILPLGNNLLVCTHKQGLYIYDKSGSNVKINSFSDISSKTKELNQFFIDNPFYHGIELSDSLYALSTITGNILIVNNNWDILDIVNNESIGLKSAIYYLYYQKDKSLWLALDNGISKVEISSPFRYWNDDKGITGTIEDVAKIDDKLYVSTASGVYFTNSTNTSKFEISSFTRVEGNFDQSWSFLYFQPPIKSSNKKISNLESDKNTLLLISTTKGLFQITNDKSKLISKNSSIFLSYQYKKDPSILFLGLQKGIIMLTYKNGQWQDHGFKFGIHDQIRCIDEDSLGNLWLSALYKGLYKIENPIVSDLELNKIELFDSSSNSSSLKKVRIVNYNGSLLFRSETGNFFNYCSDSGNIQSYDFPLEQHKFEVLADKLNDTVLFSRVKYDQLTGCSVTEKNDPNCWFGTTKGTCRCSNNPTKSLFAVSPTIIRKVLANDSIIFNGTNFCKFENSEYFPDFILNSSPLVDIGTILEYLHNSLTFSFSSPYFEEESQNKYSYCLENFDLKWSEWTTESKKEYTNLPEGDYIFKVKSINIYNSETPIAEFKFKILAPWYRTLVAYIAYTLLSILLIILIVKLYTRRLINEKDKLEKIVIERTQEILMQNEEILVQAEHLRDANEGITAKNEELEQQKWEITNQAVKLKKVNIELLKLSKVASETDNAITIFDKEGKMEWVNDGFVRMYGYTFEQYSKEKNIYILNGSGNPNIQESVKTCINDKKSVLYEFKTQTRDGKEIWAQTTLTHVVDKNGETINLIAIDSDITKIKHAEREILKQKQEIEDQRDKLTVSNATKNKFFRIIAHDLRNPISTLVGSTNVIFNDFDEYNKEQTKMFIGELNKLSQTTFNLLENLLDWSLTQTGEIMFSPEPIDIHSLTLENIELIKRKVDSKNIQLKINIDKNTFAFADENMVKTIIRNLLSNAVKFTPENGEIELSCLDNNESLKYSVKDSGIGINKEDQKKLLRIDSHHSTPGLSNEKGSGLGLILCKEFVEKNGGIITISSSPNSGTNIEFTLKKHYRSF